MALKIKTPKLVVNYLYLVGQRKDYKVSFRDGLNIIYGDSDTGKSSILNLVNYCLGASSLDLYDEIEIAGNYCLLEVLLLGTKYTIKRDIFNSLAEIEVYESSYDEIEDYFPKYYSPNYKKVSEDGVFSEFLLNSMNIPVVKLKESPSKEDSKMKSLSFRDIFKYNYLTQDRVGSKFLLGENYVVIARLKETFKLMYNVLDTQITQLEGIISEKNKERNELNKKNTAISSFLRETEIDSLKKILEQKEEKEVELEKLAESIAKIDSEIMSDNSDLDNIRNEIKLIEKEIYEMSTNREVREQELRQNIALRNEYLNDIKKIKGTIEVLEKFPKIEDRDTSCPVCEQTMKISSLKDQFINSNSQSIKAELNGLRRRQKDLRDIYENLKKVILKTDDEVIDKTLKLNDLREQFDKQTKELVTPYISQRDSLTSKIGGIKSDIKNLKHFYKIRNQQATIDAELIRVQITIDEYNDDLKVLKESAPTLDSIFSKLADDLQNFLRFIGMKNVQNIAISPKTYLPIIRNRDYENITSGGVRTLSSVGYYLTLLEYAINNTSNYPSFLMIDTIAKYIGKTKAKDLAYTNTQEDINEGMNDSTKYENLYKYLIGLSERYEESFQVFVVDNDLPTSLLPKLEPFIIKHYTTNAIVPGTDIGFIDDALNPTDFNTPFNEFDTDQKIEGDIFLDENDRSEENGELLN